MTNSNPVTVILVAQNETLSDVLERVDLSSIKDRMVFVFHRSWQLSSVRSRQEFFAAVKSYKEKITLVTVDRVLVANAHEEEIKVIEHRSELKSLLADHEQLLDALQHFSSYPWQEWWDEASRRLKQLSVQRLRVWILLGGSIALFATVVFVAIPSATIRVWPRETLVSHTANVLLVSSGAQVPQDRKQNIQPLLPIIVTVERALTFDEISKNFTGENATVEMTIINENNESYSLRPGTRLVNQAGMIFRLKHKAFVEEAAGIEPGTTTVLAEADPEDIYGEIVGERGNIPAGLKWEFPGLPLQDRSKIYARNPESATGGVTRYGSLVQDKDLDLARIQIEQELLRAARVRIEEEIEVMRAEQGRHFVLFSGSQYEVLTNKTYSDITIPTELVGEEITSIPVEGALTYVMLAYDKDRVMELLQEGLRDHIEKGYVLVDDSVVRDRVSVHVIEFDDNLAWVKITADLTGKQRAVLTPVSSQGRLFGEKLRDMVRGKTVDEAERIIQNFDEVDRVDVSVWPPWKKKMPSIPNHIVILPQ